MKEYFENEIIITNNIIKTIKSLSISDLTNTINNLINFLTTNNVVIKI